MARTSKYLPISTVAARNDQCRQVQLLHFNYTETRHFSDTAMHRHPFWQLEILIDGTLTFTSAQMVKKLTHGDTLLIAPGVEHGFSYQPDGALFLSFKFLWESELASSSLLHADTEYTAAFRQLLVKLVRQTVTDPTVYPSLSGVVGSLADYVRNAALTAEHTSGLPREDIVSRVHHAIQNSIGTASTVQDIARQLGLSPNYLSSEFRRHAGQRLKDALDCARAEAAAELLAYEDMRIDEIAQTLRFKDIYSFSRFFKRVKGMPPTHYRQLARE